jgi:hypothetical protein
MPTTRRKLPPLTLLAEPGCVPITKAQWFAYVRPTLEDGGGDLQTIGPWSLPVRFVAPCLTYHWGPFSSIVAVTLYGSRTLGALRQSGYHLEGRVSVLGRTTTGFTSSQLFRLPDGRLLDAGVIHARKPQPERGAA